MRALFLCSYDIRDPRRLYKALRVLKDYAGGGQYSVFECYLSRNEKDRLLSQMDEVMAVEDHFLILPLSKQAPIFTLGTAVMPMDESFYFVG
ncbi:MAG: CRISPR-associated endonuclease Cas2 [Hahellaceae bacterium]|nr:CRISPR-associated endonuclease Cas2 [Hahellaceae bacterium]MCP5212248.1 CRISPR-associated endonuclease Cas2 [Hahellaceae bacterium]